MTSTSKSEEIYLDQHLGMISRMLGCFRKSNIFGITLHAGTDIQYILKYINGKDSIIAYDLQTSLMEILSDTSKNELGNASDNNPRAYNVMLRSYLKKYVKSLKKIHREENKIIFIDSSTELLKYIGIKKKHIIRLVPTQPILTEIFNLEKFDKEQIDEFRESREKVLSATEYVKLEYSTPDQMLSRVDTVIFLEAK